MNTWRMIRVELLRQRQQALDHASPPLMKEGTSPELGKETSPTRHGTRRGC